MRSNEKKGIHLTVPEMEIAAAIMLPGGTEPPATVLCGALYYLAKSPDVLAKLRREVDEAFKSEPEMNMTTTARLTYLTATIKETLRIYSPFAGILRRRTPPEGGIICGEYVPGNTSVGVSTLAAFHSPHNFARPQTFEPGRWLPDERRPLWTENDQLDACQPFSTGPRNCLGQKLAMTEMRITLAKIIYRFNFELVDDVFKPERQKVYLVREKEPLHIHLSARRR